MWRQPRDDAQIHALMVGASSDPFQGYGWDGDHHWTCELVQEWWTARTLHRDAVKHLVTHLDRDVQPIAVAYLDYLTEGLAHDLRRYLYFLTEGSYPAGTALLPPL